MPVLTVESFRYGLDTRRVDLTGVPGTLIQGVNGHINEGGQFEKRGAFAVLGTLPGVTGETVNNYPTGLIAAGGYLVTFSHAYVHGSTPPHSFPTLSAALPAGVVLCTLSHPLFYQIAGMTYDWHYHQLVSVQALTTFQGWPVVWTTFSDGNTFLFVADPKQTDNRSTGMMYATPVGSSWNGLVWPGHTTNAEQASWMASLVYALGWTDTGAIGSAAMTYSPAGINYNLTNAYTSASTGTMALGLPGGSGSGTTGVASSVIIDLSASTAATVLSSILAPDGSGGAGMIELLTSSFSCTGVPATDATSLAVRLNSVITSPRYNATASGALVLIGVDPAWTQSKINGKTFTVTYLNGTVTCSPSTAVLGATFSPSVVTATVETSLPSSFVSVVVIVSPIGGTIPYHYAWTDVTAGGSGITIASPSAAATSLSAQLNSGQTLSGTMKCIITDSAGSPLTYTIYVPVSLSCVRVPLDNTVGGKYQP